MANDLLHSKQVTKSVSPVKKAARPKPPAAGKGRPKGSQNRNTKAIKDMILTALDGAGGVDYLRKRALDPKTASAFLTLVGKVLPLQVTGADDGPVQITQVHRVIVDPTQK